MAVFARQSSPLLHGRVPRWLHIALRVRVQLLLEIVSEIRIHLSVRENGLHFVPNGQEGSAIRMTVQRVTLSGMLKLGVEGREQSAQQMELLDADGQVRVTRAQGEQIIAEGAHHFVAEPREGVLHRQQGQEMEQLSQAAPSETKLKQRKQQQK